MNTLSPAYKSLENYGKSLVGKFAQSRILTGINKSGNCYILPAQKITGFEIVELFKNPCLMVTIDGCNVFEDSLFNVQ